MSLCMHGFRTAMDPETSDVRRRVDLGENALRGLRKYEDAMNRIFAMDDCFRGTEADYQAFLDAARLLEAKAEEHRYPENYRGGYTARESRSRVETGEIDVSYGRFNRLRRSLLIATPLDFQLEHQLWWESAWNPDGPMKGGPYMEYEDFPDWNATRMRVRLWEFYGHSDCCGGWEDPKETAEMLKILKSRLPDGADVDMELLDGMIRLFSESEEVEFH